MKTFKELFEKTTELDEAGGFSYGAKPARKGSVAYNAMMKRKEQEKSQKLIEPKDQMVGTAKVVKEDELDELSKDTLTSYHKKAVDKLVKGDVRLDKFKKREKGAMDAFNKAYKDVKEETVSEDLDDIEEANKPGWMLKQDKELAKKVKEKTDLAKKRQATYGDKSAGKSVSDEVEEAYMSSDRSKQAFKRNELDHELRHEVEPKRSEPAEPHAVHINGKKWKTFPTKSHATNVAKKIAGATVVKESIDEGKIPEMKYSDVMRKIKSGTHEATHDVKPGKHVELRHIDSGKKTTVYVKESEELDEAAGHTIEAHGIRGMKGTPWRKTFKSHEHLSDWADKNDSVEVRGTRDLENAKTKKTTNEEVDFHAQAMEHKKKSDSAMDKNDMEAYHHHMSAHHESMGQWHEAKGRSSSAEKEYDKAESHHELSLKKSNQKNEGTDMLSFKYFQEVLEEAKKKCKESASELENSHDMEDMEDMEDELDDEEKDELEEAINEVLSKDATAGDWISDFVHSDNPKFAGKSKEKRKQMALAAYYAKQRNEEVELDEQAPVAPVPGMKSGKYAIMVHPESKQRVTIERKNKKNYPEHEGWKEVGLGVKLKEEVEELDEAAITHIVAKKDLASHKEWMDSEGFDTKTKPLPKSHPKHATHVGIVSKDSKESSYHEDGHAISESIELDERNKENALKRKSMDASRGSRFKLQGNPVPEPEAGHKTPQAHNKAIGRAIRQMTREEYEMIDEISTATMGHAGKTTLKHIKNPGVQLRMAAHDIKPGIKGYRDRVALMHAADAEKKLKENVDEASPFDWKAYSKERGTTADKKTKTFHDVKKTSTGTVYTKQVNPDGLSKGSGDDAAKEVEKADAPKRGRGRPAGVGARTGSYKPRDPAAKAASAAKSAASKAASRAMRKESFDEEFMSSLIEGFEDEDFDDFLQCEEFSELDEETQDTLFDFINEKHSTKMKESLTGNQHKLDKNKNGKVDSHDFKLLRKEENEQLKESVTSYAAFLNKK